VYWFRKTHDQLPDGGRAGLVGTQNVRNNWSRIGGLDYIVDNGGTITDAVSAQVWSGEAAVHVSIVNWTKGDDPKPPYRLSIQRGDLVDSPWETFELSRINSALSPAQDVTDAVILRANREPARVYTGQYPRHDGFMISEDEAKEMIRNSPRNKEVLRPFLVGREFLVGTELDRWVIDFQTKDLFEARRYALPFAHIETYVLPHVQKLAAHEREKTKKQTGQDQHWLKKWWQHFRPRAELIGQITKLPRYIVCSRVTKRPIFVFLSPEIRPGDALSCFAFSDDYSFGILQSDVHWRWFIATCSKLKGDFRYTPESVFDTFPWPQKSSREQITAVAEAAVALRALRRETMGKLNYSLRDLYRTLEQPGDNPLRDAHARLDAAVRAAYGMSDAADPLAFLLELNLACAVKEKVGEKITPPGLPLPNAQRSAFVTNDCIRIEQKT